VEFEYQQHSEAYYHTVKAFIANYLDGEESENLDVVGFADYICSRASIGQVITSPLDEKDNPENNPELMMLSDEEFDKEAVKYNS
jgi:hypothetical protein